MESFRPGLLLAAIFVAVAAWAHAPRGTADYEKLVDETLPRVPELVRLEREAAKRGLRLWLFGGTAAAFAHYVRDKQRLLDGDTQYAAARFDDDFTSIFRSTQDLDVVVDDREPTDDETHFRKLREFEALINENPELRYFRGSKSAWEVRSLRRTNGTKVALLENPDYLDQHLDSMSTGLVELTPPAAGTRRIRDVKAWNNRTPPFLRDVLDGRITYYWSPRHETTSRFQQGLNPPLFSAVRLFTKAAQYDLAMTDTDREQARREIQAFDRTRDLRTDYARDWIENNGIKLYLHANDVVATRRVLDDTGLRRTLRAIRNDPDTEGSLAWWMEKSPLPEWEVGQGTGATAASLGIDVVAHDTSTFVVYEAIRRSRRGVPNVFQSRSADSSHPRGYPGENASKGTGFYVRRGNVGGRGTGITIRFRMKPNARAGHDFTEFADQIVIHHRACLEVITESLPLGALEFLSLVSDPGFARARDLGVFEVLRRRSRQRLALSDAAERERFYFFGEELLGRVDQPNARVALDEWFLLANTAERKRLVHSPNGKNALLALMTTETFASFVLSERPDATQDAARVLFSLPSTQWPWPAVLALVRHSDLDELIAAFDSHPIARHVEFLVATHTMQGAPRLQQLREALVRRWSKLTADEQDAVAPALVAAAADNFYGTRWGGAVRLWTSLHEDWRVAVGRLAKTGWLDEVRKQYGFHRSLGPTDFGIPRLDTRSTPLFDTLADHGVSDAVAFELVRTATTTDGELLAHGTLPRIARAKTPRAVYDAVYAAASQLGRGDVAMGEAAGRRLATLGASAEDYRIIATIPWQSRASANAIARIGALEGLQDGDWLAIFEPVPPYPSSERHVLEAALTQTLLRANGKHLRSVDANRLDRVVHAYEDRVMTAALRRLRAEPEETATPASLLRRWAPWPDSVYFGEEAREWAIRDGLDAFFRGGATLDQGEQLLATVSTRHAKDKSLGAKVRRRLLPLARRPADFLRIFSAREEPLGTADLVVARDAIPMFFDTGASPEDLKALEASMTYALRPNGLADVVEAYYEEAWKRYASSPDVRTRLAAPWTQPHRNREYASMGLSFVRERLEALLRSGVPYRSAAWLRGQLERRDPEGGAEFDRLFAELFSALEPAVMFLETLHRQKEYLLASRVAKRLWPAFLEKNPDVLWLGRFLAASGNVAAELRRELPLGLRKATASWGRRWLDECRAWLGRWTKHG